MMIPYFARLVCLCLAAFFLVHLAVAAATAAWAGRAIRRAERMRPEAGARLLLWLRLLPAMAAGLVVAGLCAPSYLWLEPETSGEELGLACLLAAASGAWVCAAGMVRGTRAAVRSARYLQVCEASQAPVLLLAGVFRPKLVISTPVRQALTAEQLAVALRHEQAHGTSRDNLKRLFLLLAPDATPFGRTLGQLERGWARLAEWAADDAAVSDDRQRSLALASALVRVARLGGVTEQALATPLLGDPSELAMRVERLLDRRVPERVQAHVWPGVALAACSAVVALHPATLTVVHEALEVLAH